MNFRRWIEATEGEKVVDTSTLTSSDQNLLGNAAVAEDGHLVGYHVTDNPDKVVELVRGGKKLTATYGKGRSRQAELGPGLYVSAVPHFWNNRSTDKWSFLDTLTPEQRQALAAKLRADPTLVGKKYRDNDGTERVFHYVSGFEREGAVRNIDQWLSTGFNPIIVSLAGQPYNIKFWEPAYLEPLGIRPGQKPRVLKVVFAGRFVDLERHVHDFPAIARFIRAGYDGGFTKGGFTGNPELCIWRKECIRDVGESKS